ncbi:sugar ABC transporter substrate-binding protein [Anaerotalea alkaliphila]|uniref:Sugar ABC transporter substrate-binding protein n=1 Tax=Anaerotalea alkaliphila TaxID=2662126 RepID=A0A7X5HTM6_9FIRM|nr:sugar ABC transporter substrate-binding protein [Anaerotalea alkaliphila]NDL66443.1 sugar ABC transporter substrate-binding protein [Anaerotalea alkaliphila]
MKKTKKLASLVLALVLAASLFAGCGQKEEPAAPGGETGGGTEAPAEGGKFVVGYANLADSDVFVMARKTAMIEAAKGTNVELQFSDANNDIQKQLDQIDNFIALGVDMLVVVPVDFAGITPAIIKANESGIPVICMGIKADGGDYIYVGSENYDAGYMQGEVIAAQIPENGKVLYLAGTAGMSHSTDRRNGFLEAMAAEGRDDVQILADLDGNYDRAKGMQITEDWIQSFPEFDAIVAANDQMALGAVEALKAAQRLEGVLVTGVDGTDDAKNAVKEGTMVQTVLQDAPGQAKAAMEAILMIEKGESPEKEIIVPFTSITKENVDQF